MIPNNGMLGPERREISLCKADSKLIFLNLFVSIHVFCQKSQFSLLILVAKGCPSRELGELAASLCPSLPQKQSITSGR